MKKLILSVFVAALFSPLVYAGIPVESERECPLSGENIKITSTVSCSYMGYTMSLKSITSCDFVTAYPVCGDGLVLHRSYNDAQLASIAPVLETENYVSALQVSRFLAAYKIDVTLGDEDLSEVASSLLTGLQREGMQLLSDPLYRSSVLESVETLKSATDINAAFYLAGFGYAFWYTGDTETATDLFTTADLVAENEQNEFYALYRTLLDECLTLGLEAENCQPLSVIRPREEE